MTALDEEDHVVPLERLRGYQPAPRVVQVDLAPTAAHDENLAGPVQTALDGEVLMPLDLSPGRVDDEADLERRLRRHRKRRPVGILASAHEVREDGSVRVD